MNLMQKVFGQYKGLSKNAYVLFFGRLVTSMGAFIFPMLTLIFTQKLGYSIRETATLMVYVGFIFLLSNFIGGKLADKFNRKKIIIVLDIISVLFFYACAIVQPDRIMIVFLIISAFFASMEGPSFDALIAESTLPAEREKAFSLAYLGFNLGFMFGAVIAGFLFSNYLSLAFFLDGTTTIISTIMIILLVHPYKQDEINEMDRNEYEDHEGEKKSIFKVLFERKSLLLFLSIGFLGAYIYDQWSLIIPTYMADIWGESLGSKYFGIVAGFNGFVVILFTPIMTYLLRKKFELEKMALGAILIGASFLILINAKFIFLFFIFMLAFTIGEVINTIGSSPYLTRRVPGSHRGRLSAVIYLGFFAGAQLGKYMTGLVIDKWGFNTAFYMMAVVGLLEIILITINKSIDEKIFPRLYVTPPSMMKTSIMLEKEQQLD